MTCEACNTQKFYNAECLDCCARHVMMVYPNKHLAGSILAAINRHKGSPSREAILVKVKELVDAKSKAS